MVMMDYYIVKYKKETPSTGEEIEMETSCKDPLCVNDVAELLQHQFAIISGGKANDGCPIITFPDNNNNEKLPPDFDYKSLMSYLTSVPSMQESDMGFHLIIDRRKDKWNSAKPILAKISSFFPGLIKNVYVLRPDRFIQKALSEINILFKEQFKFNLIWLNSPEQLLEYIKIDQLTCDLGGTLIYCHEIWIQQRKELEKFEYSTQQISRDLSEFNKTINEIELPNNVESTQHLLNEHSKNYSNLKDKILQAAKQGETLLCNIKEKPSTYKSDDGDNFNDSVVGHVAAVERLLVQLQETETMFDGFWQQHSTKLRHCLELRRFEQDFRELQINFEGHLRKVNEMTEVGDSLYRIETLIKDTLVFQKLCSVDIDRAEEVISSGQHLLKIKNSCPLECVEPKCTELKHMHDTLKEHLDRRMNDLQKCRELIEKVEKANNWCATGKALLESHKIEKYSITQEQLDFYLKEIKTFVNSSKQLDSSQVFKDILKEGITPAVVSQAIQRVDDMLLMCDKEINRLHNLTVKPANLVQNVVSEPALPRQPLGGAPHPNRVGLKKAYTIPKDATGESELAHFANQNQHLSPETDEVNKIKTGHVLTELLETERLYVSELLSIINGYEKEAQSESMQHLLPNGISDKLQVIFGNLDELYKFHSDIFLKDLENCISSTDLVALCFVQTREKFFRLYSFYCQNISRSEQIRENSLELNTFFQTCQRNLGHKLPLAAYLLKPVQRITKYQLLLKDLLKYSDEGKCCKELQQALDCMLVVLKCVNDSMHQISITGFPSDLSQQGELLLQGSFSVWVDNKRDLRLRLKPMRRHLFLYQKSLLFCKPIAKAAHNKATYQFKHYLKMSQIGLTESVKGDPRKFEVWLQGRQEVHTIQAKSLELKQSWVNEIKGVLFNQLQELKGEKIKQYSALAHKPLRQTTSWETQKCQASNIPIIDNNHRTMSCDTESQNHGAEEENIDNWSSDCSGTDEDDHPNTAVPRGRYVTLADYCAVGNSEVTMREGDIVELLKVGCAGWWFVKVIGSSVEGWAPAAYLENLHRKGSRSSSRSQDRLNDH